jgi:hypothetical protein
LDDLEKNVIMLATRFLLVAIYPKVLHDLYRKVTFMNKKGQDDFLTIFSPLQIAIENVKNQTKEQNQAIGRLIHSEGNMSISV